MKSFLLVAESDPVLVDVYWRFLTRQGYEVETARAGLECLTKLRSRLPDVLVLDVDLPWGGGDGVLSWLRDEQDAQDIPVVLTATTHAADRLDSFRAAPNVVCLPKPFSLPALLDSVRAVANPDWQSPRLAPQPLIPQRLFS